MNVMKVVGFDIAVLNLGVLLPLLVGWLSDSQVSGLITY
jgi:hypothetical protein